MTVFVALELMKLFQFMLWDRLNDGTTQLSAANEQPAIKH